MRTLTSTLTTAQQATAFRPYVRVTRRRMSAWEDRYTPTVGPAGPGTQPAACAGSGTLTLAYLDGANCHVKQYSGTPPAGAAPITVHADTGNLVGCTQLGNTIAVVSALKNDAARNVNVYISTDGGQSFPTVESFVTGTAAADNPFGLACAFDTSGVLCIIVEGLARLGATRRTAANTYAATVVTSDTFQFGTGPGSTVAPGVACVYSKTTGSGDFVVVASFTTNVTFLSTVAVYLFGGGDQQAANTWSARQTLLAVQPFDTTAITPGSTLAVAGGTLTADTLRFTLLENTRNPTALLNLNTSRNYQLTIQSAAAAKLGACRDPQALLIDSTTPLVQLG